MNSTIQPKIIESIQEVFAENLDEIIPSLQPLQKKVDLIQENLNSYENNVNRISGIANASKLGIDELKQEFEYMKTRFSP